MIIRKLNVFVESTSNVFTMLLYLSFNLNDIVNGIFSLNIKLCTISGKLEFTT